MTFILLSNSNYWTHRPLKLTVTWVYFKSAKFSPNNKKYGTIPKLKSIVIFLSFVSLTSAIRPSISRVGQGCVLLHQTIYCYGGASYSPDLEDDDDHRATTYADHYALNVGSMNQVSDSSLDSWRQLPDSPMGPNAHFAIAPLSYEMGFLVHGGWGPHDQKTYLRNQTWIFYSGSESWNMISTNASQRIDLIAKMPGVSANNRVWIWGGEIDDLADSQDIPEPEMMRWFQSPQRGPQQLLMQQNIQFPSGAFTRVGHSAVVGRDGQNIFYFGGMNAESEHRDLGDDEDNGYANATMNDILVFNTANQGWTRLNSTGDIIPSPRAFHTTTLIPNTNDILLYGGRRIRTDIPVDDYIYKFNTETNQWTQISLAKTGAGPRWGHSAVLHHNDRSLFILFGANSLGASTNDFYILDVNDMSWQGRSSGDDGSGTGAGGHEESKLDGGEIAGIVIGCLAAGVITGLIVFAIYRRKKRQQELYEKYGDNPPDNQDEAIFSNLGVVGVEPPPVPPKQSYFTRIFQKPDEPSPNDISPVPQIKENKPDSRD
ncbi:hypothetical protein BDA99DRAFT_577311 [Phascolomyces articulosus]|uniref:Galactose oxidase n=1 Tax=Phascolomyces articulosus TaxID=60185 RepID=A0AAD5P725_9FUNG|nr:hypothetical protein BDA99DRAFT_577311 [Phascolomyces articulosus]